MLRCLGPALLAAIGGGQPLGGGGGGFSGGGGSDGGGHSDHSVTCPPHCRSCSFEDRCEVCDTGYMRTRTGQCTRCPSHCSNCDDSGPTFCDACYEGFVLLQGICKPCAPNCKSCRLAGEGRCDVCHEGYLLENSSSTCLACVAHCRRCTNTSSSGCEECFAMYRLSEGSCSFNTPLAALLTVLSLGAGTLICRWRPSRPAAEGVVSQESYVGALREAAREGPDFPSGLWKGYYTLAGTRHDVCEFSLRFASGQVLGEGVDDVGGYRISGLQGPGRLAFSKTYITRSHNVNGVVSYGNQGHTVEYRGELAGASLGAGLRGQWSIRHVNGSSDGSFHIWPAMEGWADMEPEGPAEGPTFSENECVICYDRPIAVRLSPCGHQALCMECAVRLSPRICPLCRVAISHITSRET